MVSSRSFWPILYTIRAVTTFVGTIPTTKAVRKTFLLNPLTSTTIASSFSTTTTTATTTKTKLAMSSSEEEQRVYTIPDQPARFARAKTEKNQRYLDITAVYDPSFLKDKRVAITGANRGIGLALAKELTSVGAKVIAIVRSTSDELDALKPNEMIKNVDVTDDKQCETIKDQITGGPIDILINNAGYFRESLETLDTLDFQDQMKTIDICAVGPLRVTSSLLKGNLLLEGSKVIMLTSQGGSVGWRTVQNPNGTDYGHHMSKAAANMMSVLLAQEVRNKNIMIGIFHPGFNKTDMTAKYKHIWEIEGAVDASIGAKRVLHEVGLLTMERTGKFINCEDGLEIPW